VPFCRSFPAVFILSSIKNIRQEYLPAADLSAAEIPGNIQSSYSNGEISVLRANPRSTLLLLVIRVD
jgi:hypothetical protein